MERRVRIASRNGLPYANAPVLIITLREGPIRHSVGCRQSIQGLATQGCLLVFSEPEPQFRNLTVILEFSRKKLYADCFGFSIVQLFWSFLEKNCTPLVSVFRSYSYFEDFPKKTVRRLFWGRFSCLRIEIFWQRRNNLHGKDRATGGFPQAQRHAL